VLLDRGGDSDVGFGAFAFKSFPEFAPALSAHCNMHGRIEGERHVPILVVDIDPGIERRFAEIAASTAEEFLSNQGLRKEDISVYMPPQISSACITQFAKHLGIDTDRCLDVTVPDGDLFTASVPHCLREVEKRGMCGSGDIGLIVNVASGLEVGCATYYF
jgi:3-oxoacyl-[acyl-carrier-protein] synthase III